MNRDYWTVGEKCRGAGTPTPGEPYVVPTVNAEGLLCDMEIEVTRMTDPRHYEGIVRAITPVDQESWNIWKASNQERKP